MSRLAPVLTSAAVTYFDISQAHSLAIQGREREALLCLAAIARRIEGEKVALRDCIIAQREAAEALDLAQGRQPIRILCAIGGPAKEHPDAANAHPANPIQPAPFSPGHPAA